jgi:hypothetical protein
MAVVYDEPRKGAIKMTLCTVTLLLAPTTIDCGETHVRHPASLQCDRCDKTYVMEYQSHCTDPSDVAEILRVAQRFANREHYSEHREDRLTIPINIPPQPS